MEENISMQIMMRLRQIIQEMSRHSKQLQEKYNITLPQLRKPENWSSGSESAKTAGRCMWKSPRQDLHF